MAGWRGETAGAGRVQIEYYLCDVVGGDVARGGGAAADSVLLGR